MPHCVTQFLELEDIENRIDSAIKSCSPRSWDENIITDQILRALTRSPLLKVSQAPPLNIKIAFDAFKQKGKLETNYGDIAFIVKVTLPNGNVTTGIAFLEAKRFYKNSNSYQMIGNWTQLNKMASNVSNHYLLLYHYDVQPTPVMHLGGCLLQPCQVCAGVESRAITVKTPLAITYNTVGEELSTIGHRLSEQIYLRFFRGLDLEFNPSLVSRVIKGTDLQVSFLVLANVVLGESDLEPSINEFAQPFLNRYSRLSESSAGAS